MTFRGLVPIHIYIKDFNQKKGYSLTYHGKPGLEFDRQTSGGKIWVA